MKALLKITALFFLLVSFAPSAFAITLQEAKDQGLVGERVDGYLGYVVATTTPDVIALVEQVNEERRRRYQEIATSNGIDINQVAVLAYEQAVAATQPGHYIQNQSGQWQRK